MTERIDDTIDAAWEEATSVRQYLEYTNEVRQAMGLEDPTGVYKTLFQTLDDVEKKIGKALTSSDPQYAQFEDAIDKGMSVIVLSAKNDDLLSATVGYNDIEISTAEFSGQLTGAAQFQITQCLCALVDHRIFGGE